MRVLTIFSLGVYLFVSAPQVAAMSCVGASRDLSLVTKINAYAAPNFREFQERDRFIVSLGIDSIRNNDVQNLLRTAGFRSNSEDHPYHLAGGTYREIQRDGLDTRFLVSVSSEAQMESLLAFVKKYTELDATQYMGPIRLGIFVHSRDGQAVTTPD